MSERATVQAIQRLLTRRGAWWINTHGNAYGRNGIPDIVAVYRGTPLCIEAKTPEGRLRPLQRHELERARHAGATTLVARRVGDVDVLLNQIDSEEAP